MTSIALLGTLALLASPAVADGAAANDLVGTSWRLVELNGSPADDAVSSTLVISAGNVGGNGGCNTFGGELKLTATSIDISQIISTMMACDGLRQEQAYFAALEAADAYSIVDGDLVLGSPGASNLARLSPAEQKPRAIFRHGAEVVVQTTSAEEYFGDPTIVQLAGRVITQRQYA